MKILELEKLSRNGETSGLSIYCMTALVADEASRSGFAAFAKAVEAAMAGLLAALPRDEQMQALHLAYELALGGEEPAPPRLRLVYSRD